jgi:glucarate dehydratase
MRFLLANPTASLYNNRTQLVAAIEFACLDVLGQAWGVPVYDILGGPLRDRVPFASYLFFRYPGTKGGEVRTAEQLVANASLKKHDSRPTNSKAAVPSRLRAEASAAAAPPPATASPIPARCGRPGRRSRFGQAIEIRQRLPEDPVGLHGMRRVRERSAARHQHRRRQLRQLSATC